MMPDQVQRYENTRKTITDNYDRIMSQIDSYDPYESGRSQEILDTDYDNFMYLYSCKDQEVHLNALGQTQTEIEQLKVEDRERRLMVGERAKDSINAYLNTLGDNQKFVKFVQVIQM